MLQNEIMLSLIELGKFLSQFSSSQPIKNSNVKNNDLFFDKMVSLIENAQHQNGWFTPENVQYAIQSWGKALTKDNLENWLSKYNFSERNEKNVGLILAGNIPLVGFHDIICVLTSGHKAIIKLSSNDHQLTKFLLDYLIEINEIFASRITFTEGKLEGFDAVIATGSNNTARYFEYYFSSKPNIIRKNRNSVAILTGKETKEELVALGEDIFTYFGLGCRNVSKIFVPENYDFKLFFEAMFEYGDIIHYEKYANNYDYNKAVFLMSNYSLLDNEFLLLKEDKSFSSPIGSLFYEYYSNFDAVIEHLHNEADKIQCIVSNQSTKNHIPFGYTQKPNLWDYADNVDTIEFLLNL